MPFTDLWCRWRRRQLHQRAVSAEPCEIEKHRQAAERKAAERVAVHAVALRALLNEAPGVLSPAERHLLSDWLDRLTASAAVRVSADDRRR